MRTFSLGEHIQPRTGPVKSLVCVCKGMVQNSVSGCLDTVLSGSTLHLLPVIFGEVLVSN